MVSSILAIWQGSGQGDIPDYNGHEISLEKNKYKIESDYGDVFGYTHPSSLEGYALDSSLVHYLLSLNYMKRNIVFTIMWVFRKRSFYLTLSY